MMIPRTNHVHASKNYIGVVMLLKKYSAKSSSAIL